MGSLCDEVLDPHQQKLSGIDPLGNEIPDKHLANRALDFQEIKKRFNKSTKIT